MERLFSKLLTIAALCIVAAASSTGNLSADWYDWPMFHHNPQRTGVAGGNGIFTVVGTKRWEFNAKAYDADAKITASPVVANDGTIYAVSTSSSGGKVYALDHNDGNPKQGWTIFSTPNIEISSTPGISPKVSTYNPPTRIYVGTHETRSTEKNFFALNPTTGAVVWSLKVPGSVKSSSSLYVVMDPSGKPAIYVGTTSGDFCKIVDLDTKGSYTTNGGWQTHLSAPILFPSSPALSLDNGTVFVGICKFPTDNIAPCYDFWGNPTPCDDWWGYLVALNANDGSIKWSIQVATGGSIQDATWVYSPAVTMTYYPTCQNAPAGYYETVFAGTNDWRVRSVREVAGGPIGMMDFDAFGSVVSCPAICDLNGDDSLEVIFGSANTNVYAVTFTPGVNWNACCKEYWHYTTGSEVFSSASVALAPQPTIFIGSNDFKI